MFTGLIEEMGTIEKIEWLGQGRKFSISGDVIFSDLKVDDSISTNGCCLTVTSVTDKKFTCIAVEETLKKTTLGLFQQGQKVNLERALLPSTRLGGHFVQGHVDTVGEIIGIESLTTSKLFEIQYPINFKKYLIHVGSICVDGTSLTVAELNELSFKVAIIPHTLEKTIFANYKVGSKVNLEFDLLGKYIENILNERKSVG